MSMGVTDTMTLDSFYLLIMVWPVDMKKLLNLDQQLTLFTITY